MAKISSVSLWMLASCSSGASPASTSISSQYSVLIGFFFDDLHLIDHIRRGFGSTRGAVVRSDGDDDDESFPGPAKLAEVKEWLMLFAPIALPEPIVLAPNPKVIDLVFSSLTLEDNADPATVKAAIIKSIKDMIAVRAEPPKNRASKFYKSWLNEAISKAVSEFDHKLSFPAGDVALAQWDLVTLGSVTWP